MPISTVSSGSPTLGGSSNASAAIAFTDGDTSRRATITNSLVTSSSQIIGTVRRPDTASDSADMGYIYIANVVRVGSGSFDLLVTCLDASGLDPTPIPPSETVQYIYRIT